jgi:hypothetical protein
MDGVQYLALKLLLQADTVESRAGDLRTILTNILNITLREKTLPH